MQKFLLTFLSVFLTISLLFAQPVVINELDCDTPGIDDKEFVELKSATPNFPLDGYVLVFFNGSSNGGNRSYLTLDLTGSVTDINGLLLIGSNTVMPFPQYFIPANTIQNGEDAIALYQANALDIPDSTLAFVDNRLIDVLIYGTSDPQATGLLNIFQPFYPNIAQQNEGAGNNTNSIQRNNDGTYFTGTPTPRRLNDGTGIILNGLLTTLTKTMYDEGDTLHLNFTLEQEVVSDFTFNFTLSNGTFNSQDFIGNTTLTIPAGQNSVSTLITLVDDTLDEGDEVLVVRFPNLPSTFLAANNLRIRVVDNDFRVAPFGTPLNSTYGIVSSTAPIDYYQGIDGKSGQNLRNSLQHIIADQSVVRAQTYNDLIQILEEADQNPENSNQVWLVYLEKGRPKLDFQLTSTNTGTWNREHTWPRSRGGFNSIDRDTLIDGRDIYWTTNADSLRHANSDAHAIRAVDGPENSSRGNLFYGQYNGPAGTVGGFKGDVARGIFYLDIRYNGLEVVNGYPDGMVGKFGDLATLLEWHRNDPPDDFEMNRNNVVYSWQFNRNPFIDQPDLVEYIWGNKMGETWQQPTNTVENQELSLKIYPNPASNQVEIRGIDSEATVEIHASDGTLQATHRIFSDTRLDLPKEKGLYFLKISTKGKVFLERLVVH